MRANSFAMQEFVILLVGTATSTEAMKMGFEVYHKLKDVLKEHMDKMYATLGPRGGGARAPIIGSNGG